MAIWVALFQPLHQWYWGRDLMHAGGRLAIVPSFHMEHTCMHLGASGFRAAASCDALKSSVPESTDPSATCPSEGACSATLTSAASPTCPSRHHGMSILYNRSNIAQLLQVRCCCIFMFTTVNWGRLEP